MSLSCPWTSGCEYVFIFVHLNRKLTTSYHTFLAYLRQNCYLVLKILAVPHCLLSAVIHFEGQEQVRVWLWMRDAAHWAGDITKRCGSGVNSNCIELSVR